MTKHGDDFDEDLILKDEISLVRQNPNIIKENFYVNENDIQHKTEKNLEIVAEVVIESEKHVVHSPVIENSTNMLLNSAMVLISNSEKNDVDVSINLILPLPDLNLISTISKTAGVDKGMILDNILSDENIRMKIMEAVKDTIKEKLNINQ